MHKTFCEYLACGSGNILADRQTNRQTHTETYSSQDFATSPASEVIIIIIIISGQRIFTKDCIDYRAFIIIFYTATFIGELQLKIIIIIKLFKKIQKNNNNNKFIRVLVIASLMPVEP